MGGITVHDVKGRFPVLPSHVHGYVVELPGAVVIVDATAAISSSKELRSTAEATGKPIAAVLVTHGHPDHFTGLVTFADVPRYASQGCIDFAHREDENKWRSGKQYLGDDFPDTRVFPETVVRDGQTLAFDGVDFTFHDMGPGESDADGLWLCESDGIKHAFVGDTVSKGTHAFFGDGHALQWLEIIDRLERELDETSQIHSGHGETPASYADLAWQRGYIQAFIEAIRPLKRESPVSQATVELVVAKMKEYLPSDDLLFLLGYELDQGIARTWKQLDSQ